MNTNPNAARILCFGDSNTWGQRSDKQGRQPADVRWPGLLQRKLGDGFAVIEEGLSSRTTDLEYAKRPGRNGKEYLVPCLTSQSPLKLVVLMLGSNDLKLVFNRSADEIAAALNGLIDDIQAYAANDVGGHPKILLISPIEIVTSASRFLEFYDGIYDESSREKSKQLPAAIQKLAEQRQCLFLDAAMAAKPGEDGLHLSDESHLPLADAVFNVIEGLEL